jgi:4-amino-4-deoxy-L-arabinose transferase-like glycosyltransferase
MFEIAFLIGILSYIVLALGFAGLLYKNILLILLIFYVLAVIYVFRKTLLIKIKTLNLLKAFKNIFNDRFGFLLIILLLFQIIVNLMGVFSPEYAFDALWYHLTLPKLYLINHSIFYIPGGLLYYSAMPKLGELLYILTLSFSSEIFAKLIHFTFGILSSIVIYKLSRKYLPKSFSLLAVLIFYSNIAVAFLSTTAYIDLVRTFFEIMSFWGFIEWTRTHDRKWLLEAAVLLGLSVSVKIISLMSLFIFVILIVLQNKNAGNKIKNVVFFTIPVFIVISPWLIFSYLNTGNPIYPFLSETVNFSRLNFGFLNPINLVIELFTVFIKAADPISPIYLIFIPFVFIKYRSFNKYLKYISIYVVLALLGWYFFEFSGRSIPEIKGGARYLVPYLSVFSILISYIIYSFKKNRLRTYSLLLVVFLSVTTIGYRAMASIKYMPYLTGRETKKEFLLNHLNFSYGDFYDTDNFFKNNIKNTDIVLLYGFHNLYYIDFPFIDSSWVKKGDLFNYIATQNVNLPNRYKDWDLIYVNSKTNVKLYTNGGIKWQF